jgi:DNA polymerase-1
MNYLMRIIKKEGLEIEQVALCFDKSRLSTFRVELYPEYKGNRPPKPVPLKEQLSYIKAMLKEYGFKVFEADRYEADDLVGMLAKNYEDKTKVCILTKDKDYLQLVSENTHVWMMRTTKDVERLSVTYGEEHRVLSNVYDYTKEVVEGEMGVAPEQVASLKAISGDPSDNIPGVKGVSDKTIIPLLKEYGDLKSIYKELVSAKKSDKLDMLKKEWGHRFNLRGNNIQNLLDGMYDASLFYKLTRIKTDGKISYDLDHYGIANVRFADLAKKMSELELFEIEQKIKDYMREV